MPQTALATIKRSSPALPNVSKTSPITKSTADRKTRTRPKFTQTPVVYLRDTTLFFANHSIYGVISGSLRKKLGLVIIRFKLDAGESCYQIDTIPAVEISGGK